MPSCQLTIITPVFNGAAYIERCLRNVLEQDCAGVEHLVMDGGSTDGTPGIVERFAREHPRIRLVSERDDGQSDAMNKGVELAAAPVISFLNADDTYEPGTLRRVIELLPGLNEPGFLVGNCNVRDEAGRITCVNRPSRLRIDDLLVGSPRMPHPLNPSAYFYHRSLHGLVGPYDVSDNFNMDLDFLLRALPVANVRYVNETWGNFFMLPGAKTFEDFAQDQGRWRGEAVLRRALARLPQPRRLIVRSRRLLHKLGKLPGLLVYYSNHPAMITKRLERVLHRAELSPPLKAESGEIKARPSKPAKA